MKTRKTTRKAERKRSFLPRFDELRIVPTWRRSWLTSSPCSHPFSKASVPRWCIPLILSYHQHSGAAFSPKFVSSVTHHSSSSADRALVLRLASTALHFRVNRKNTQKNLSAPLKLIELQLVRSIESNQVGHPQQVQPVHASAVQKHVQKHLTKFLKPCMHCTTTAHHIYICW